MKLKKSIKNIGNYENYGHVVVGADDPARDAYPKNTYGITLIALVVTIIVLLILAGVSLNLIAGSNGILSKTTKTVNKTKQAAIEERRQIARAEALIRYKSEEYTDKNGDKAVIPAGFAPTGVDGETEIENGLVITDPDGNEFVWIPVKKDGSDYIKKLGTNNWYVKAGSTGLDTAEALENDVSKAVLGDLLDVNNILGVEVYGGLDANQPEKEIVKAVGGFWVGRYEAGVDSTDDVEILSADWYSQMIVSKQGVQPVRYIYRKDALKIANSWVKNSSVQSGLITGTQWDMMCKFIGWSIADSDGSSWGNCRNVESTYYNDLWHSENGNAWVHEISSVLKEKNIAWLFPTGTFITANGNSVAKKNIYDISGNVSEWTTEHPAYFNGAAIIRGGAAETNRR